MPAQSPSPAAPYRATPVWKAAASSIGPARSPSPTAGCRAIRGAGGGIYNYSGTVTLTDSTLSGNVGEAVGTGAGGGGIQNYSGTVSLVNSTVSDNSATHGAGILSGGTLNVTGSTLSGNIASKFNGGGIANGGTAYVSDSTLSGNSAGGDGGGIFTVATAA